jgi:hypothetical protein
MTGQRNEWSAEYLHEAFKDEIELAWAKLRRRYVAPNPIEPRDDLRPAPRRGSSLINAGSARLMLGSTEPTAPPHWRRSWAAAGPLIGELGLSVRTCDEEGTVSVGNGSRRRDVTESYADHPNKDAAICAAIVRAAIRVCTESREAY